MNTDDAIDWDDAYSNFAYIPDGLRISGQMAEPCRAISRGNGQTKACLKADLSYGAHARNRLDLFMPLGRSEGSRRLRPRRLLDGRFRQVRLVASGKRRTRPWICRRRAILCALSGSSRQRYHGAGRACHHACRQRNFRANPSDRTFRRWTSRRPHGDIDVTAGPGCPASHPQDGADFRALPICVR